MNVTIWPGKLAGTIVPPSSKSQGHRYVIAAALAAGESVIGNLSFSEDIEATLRCMAALGAIVERQTDGVILRGGPCPGEIPVLDCGESGSTLRFLIPVALALAGGGIFRGRGRLMQRPQEPYFAIFREKGIAFSAEGETLTIKGRLTPDVYELPGNVSSQFITGLMYALPLLDGDSEIRLTSPLESAGYIEMTREALRRFGVRTEERKTGWFVPGNQTSRPENVQVEADYSQAAFFAAARGMGHNLQIMGLDASSCQGDRIILDYEKELDGTGTVELDVRNCPDLVPALAARAAVRAGEITRIGGAGRLRIKESDRLAAVTDVLRAMGAEVTEEPEGLTIRGRAELVGGVAVDSWNDHRIAMMAAVAAMSCKAPVTVTGAQCVRKSYPGFWDDLKRLGAVLEVSE